MKKLLFFFVFLLSLSFSCRKAKQSPHQDSWEAYRKAYTLLSTRQDSAFYYFNQIVSDSRDSLPVAMSYSNMAMIQSDAGDYFGAQESLTSSLKFLDEKDTSHYRCLTNDYNELGMNSANLKNQDAALAFYLQALRFTDNKELRRAILNNQASAYQEKKDYARAIRLYTVVLGQAGTNRKAFARALTNLATARWQADPAYPAGQVLRRALKIREEEHDLWGQNASDAHLADYYTGIRRDSALFFAGSMYRNASRLGSPDDRLEALEKLVRLAPAAEVQRYFGLYRRLGDSIQGARNAAKNQFALIRYDVEKQKSENLGLQKENAARRYQLNYQQFLLGFAVFVLVAGTGFVMFWNRKRKQRMELEKQNEIRGDRLRTAKKVHDVLANGLYRVMSSVENGVEMDKEVLLDNLEDLYERTRDISYEEPDLTGGNFVLSLSGLLMAFAGADLRVVLAGNTEELWIGVGLDVRQELYYVLQELMVNMKKHSHAGNVALLFERAGNRVSVHYTDDGRGMPEEVRYKNGLTNTGNRIKAIRGEIIFDSHAGKGLEVRITFPLD